jgi:hypothetical protein
MKLTRTVAFAGLLALSAVPASAQDTAADGGWVNWGYRMVNESIDTLAYPFQQAWTMAWDVIGKTEADVAEEKVKFATKLKSELESFSKDVSRTGYDLSMIGISPDIIPKIALTLEVRNPLDETAEAKLRSEFQDPGKQYGTIERAILLGLLDLDETAADLQVNGYKFSEVELELVALFPEVTLNFEHPEESGSAPKAEDATSPALSN